MLATCKQLPGSEQTLCRDVANYKRSCLHAMKSMLQGTNWAVVRSLPDAVTCREGLRRAGYPVNTISQRLASALR